MRYTKRPSSPYLKVSQYVCVWERVSQWVYVELTCEHSIVWYCSSIILNAIFDIILDSLTRRLTLSPTLTLPLLTTTPTGKPVIGGPLNAEKLRAKAVQFFPNIALSVQEINQTPPVSTDINLVRAFVLPFYYGVNLLRRSN